MTLLNKVWNHHDDWAPHLTVVSNMKANWEQTLTKLATQNPRGFDQRLDFCHLIKVESTEGQLHDMFTSTHKTLACMMEYRFWGQQTVVVGPEMQKAFGDTELGKVPASHLKLPFPAYWIAFPENEEMLLWGGAPNEEMGGYKLRGTGWHRVEGAYVLDLGHISNGKHKGLLVYMWAPNPVDMSLREKNKELGVPVLPTDDMAHMWFSLEFDDNKEIEQQIQDTFADPLSEVFDYDPLDPNRSVYDGLSINREEEVRVVASRAALMATRIIINSALYMVSPRADLMGIKSAKREELLNQAKDLRDQSARTSGKSARHWRRQAEHKERKAKRYKPPVTWIGPNIEKAIGEGREASTRTRSSKQKGHVRKGHWHMFRTGRMKDEFGVKIPNEQRDCVYHWIPPTWCGDLDTKHESHTYVFKEV